MHRTTRNAQQKAKLLSPDYSGLILDPILQRLMDPSIEPGFEDFRHCLVFWARPPAHIRSLVDKIQQELLKLAPSKSNICVLYHSSYLRPLILTSTPFRIP